MSDTENITAVQLMQQIAREGFVAWDEDRDMRAGKILMCLAGMNPGYRPDLDAALAFEVPAGLHAVERLLAEVRRRRADVAQLVAALHALVQVHHDAQRHQGKWSECREPACAEAQVALLERAGEENR